MKRIAVVLAIGAMALIGCGSEGSTSDEADPQPEVVVSEQEQIEQVSEEWAAAFGRGDIDEMCDLTTDPGSADNPYSCKGIYSYNAWAKSMADATVSRAEYFGNEAVAELSNGDVIELVRGPDGWLVDNFGGSIPFKLSQ